MIGSSKVGLPILVASLAVTTAAFAGNGEVKPNNCKGPSLCHTRPDLECADFVFDVGFLLEQARVSGTSYGYLIKDSGTAIGLAQNAEGLRPSFGMDWGVTVGGSYFFEHDDWMVSFDFNWMKSYGKDEHDSTFGSIIIPVGTRSENTASAGQDFTFAQSAKATHDINFFFADFSLARGNYMSGCFSISPHFGLEAAIFQNKVDVQFTGGTDLNTNIYYVSKKDNSWGLGPEAGIDAYFSVTNNVGFFLEQQGAILVGAASINDRGYSSSNTSGLTNTYKESDIVTMAPAMRTFIGVQYESYVFDGDQFVKIKAGWDNHFYWDQYITSQIVNEMPTTAARVHTQEANHIAYTGFKLEVSWHF